MCSGGEFVGFEHIVGNYSWIRGVAHYPDAQDSDITMSHDIIMSLLGILTLAVTRVKLTSVMGPCNHRTLFGCTITQLSGVLPSWIPHYCMIFHVIQGVSVKLFNMPPSSIAQDLTQFCIAADDDAWESQEEEATGNSGTPVCHCLPQHHWAPWCTFWEPLTLLHSEVKIAWNEKKMSTCS